MIKKGIGRQVNSDFINTHKEDILEVLKGVIGVNDHKDDCLLCALVLVVLGALLFIAGIIWYDWFIWHKLIH